MGNEKEDKLKEVIYRDRDMLNKGDFDMIDELYSEDYIEPYSGVKGREGARQEFIETKKGFPDLTFTIEDTIVKGNVIVTRYTITGTHRGAFKGIPPTGKTFKVMAITIDRIEGGKFVEHWSLYDIFSMLVQLGVKEVPQGF